MLAGPAVEMDHSVQLPLAVFGVLDDSRAGVGEALGLGVGTPALGEDDDPPPHAPLTEVDGDTLAAEFEKYLRRRDEDQ